MASDAGNSGRRLRAGGGAVALAAAAGLAGLGGAASAQTVLLRDDFNGSAPDVNRAVWTGPAAGHPALGRTFLRPGTAPIPIVNGAAVLRLDTFNASAAGWALLGSEISTRTLYSVGTGVAFEARVMPAADIPRGAVASVFTYVIRDVGGGRLEQDEIDWEILTNLVQGQSPPQVWTNVYVNEFLGAGSPVALAAPKVKPVGAWNTYRIEWYPGRVRWLLNGRVVMDRTDRVPNDAMNLRLNFWAPASDWPQAFSADLQPVGTFFQNRSFEYLVDWAMVTRLPGFADRDADGDGRFNVDDLYRMARTTTDANADGAANAEDVRAVELPLREAEAAVMARDGAPAILVNPSFEAATPGGPVTGWSTFGSTIGNVLRDGECPRTGGVSLKIYGQFNGQTNQSGAQQTIRVSGGQTLAVTAFARHPCGDRLAGANAASVEVQFLSGSGAAVGGPVSATALTAGSPCDVHIPVTLTALVPAQATTARVRLVLRQQGNAVGAVHFDDVSPVVTGP